MSYVVDALAAIKKAGYKITAPKRELLRMLEKSEVALSPYEMRDVLAKKKVRINIVTLYRLLEVFEELGLVHKIFVINAYLRCLSESKKSRCHHYAVCTRCHAVEEISGENLAATEKKLRASRGFETEGHCLEFIGVCKTCRNQRG